MSKSQLTISLAIQNTYDHIQLALMSNQNCIDSVQEDKKYASKLAIPLLSSLLQKNQVSLADIAFIGVNQGPGPFTTLRVIIATVNGLSFATKIPLIGIDGLDALLAQEATPDYPATVALLNAFNNDVYFGIDLPSWQNKKRGYGNVDRVLEQISSFSLTDKIRFIGNGTSLYAHRIEELLGNRAFIPTDIPQTCHVQQIGRMAYEYWIEGKSISHQLMPLYLKSQQYKNQQGIMTAI